MIERRKPTNEQRVSELLKMYPKLNKPEIEAALGMTKGQVKHAVDALTRKGKASCSKHPTYTMIPGAPPSIDGRGRKRAA